MQQKAEEISEGALLERARAGASDAFDALARPHRGALHTLAYRLVSDPSDAEDLVQESLLQAFRKLDGFRGDAKFRTWLFSIATHKCLDHLRKKRRWSIEVQDQAARQHLEAPSLMATVDQITAKPGFRYEYREHIAYCLSCIGRSLLPEESAAIVLREILEFNNVEAAKAVGLSLSTFRHRLASGRKKMCTAFEGRCALIGKQGICWQCETVRTILPEDRNGEPPHAIADADEEPERKLDRRFAIAREAKLGNGTTGPMHVYFLRYLNETFG